MKSKNRDSAFDLLDIVGIVLAVLKVVGVEPVAHWSWIAVLSPFWIGIVAIMLFAALGAFFDDEKKEGKQG